MVMSYSDDIEPEYACVRNECEVRKGLEFWA